MNKKRLIILIILTIFIIGMVCGTATASHTIKAGKYKGTISDKQYNQLKKAKKQDTFKSVTVKTKQYKTLKIPKYKTVKKKVWVYKTVLRSKLIFSDDWSDSTSHDYNIKKYWDNWKWYGSKNTQSKDGHTLKYYEKFKKKVTKKVKVKNGYKKVKVPIYMNVRYDLGTYTVDFYSEYKDTGYSLYSKDVSVI